MPWLRVVAGALVAMVSTLHIASAKLPNRVIERLVAEVVDQSITIDNPIDGVHRGETVFRIAEGPLIGELGFSVSRSALRFEVKQQDQPSAESSVAIDQKVQILQPLLRRFFATQSAHHRLEFQINYFSELAPRLAAAAAHSKKWNRSSGRPFSGSSEEFVKNMLNVEHLYPELEKLFSNFNYSIQAIAVEKVMIEKKHNLTGSEFTVISKQLKPHDKLPVSASIYFELIPEDLSSPGDKIHASPP
jgi:hypothetical protein